MATSRLFTGIGEREFDVTIYPLRAGNFAYSVSSLNTPEMTFLLVAS